MGRLYYLHYCRFVCENLYLFQFSSLFICKFSFFVWILMSIIVRNVLNMSRFESPAVLVLDNTDFYWLYSKLLTFCYRVLVTVSSSACPCHRVLASVSLSSCHRLRVLVTVSSPACPCHRQRVPVNVSSPACPPVWSNVIFLKVFNENLYSGGSISLTTSNRR